MKLKSRRRMALARIEPGALWRYGRTAGLHFLINDLTRGALWTTLLPSVLWRGQPPMLKLISDVTAR
jgi:hypothetical protein